jgi:hypothetical protein
MPVILPLPEQPMPVPSTSRRPSVFTATAMVTAAETMRPFWRTLM